MPCPPHLPNIRHHTLGSRDGKHIRRLPAQREIGKAMEASLSNLLMSRRPAWTGPPSQHDDHSHMHSNLAS